MHLTDYIPRDAEGTIWDVVVVGTGAGGGPAGLRLAQSGKSVLFLERGGFWDTTMPTSAKPHFLSVAGEVDYGSLPDSWQNEIGLRENRSEFVMSSGIGGTTTLFSMAMDRLQPLDFTPHRFAHCAPESTLPAEWPIQYEELDPYYHEAESLFRIQGSPDPLTSIRGTLRDPLSPSQTEESVVDTLIRGDLHPYSMHCAREYLQDCDGCHNRPCPRSCRNDAGRTCVIPALETYGARILPNCVVERLETGGRSVRHALCSWNGRCIAIRARIFILALGALLTPALLFRSANDSFPNGLGNSSGMLGRNLMTHVSDILVVRMKGLGGVINGRLRNGISMNDFYSRNGIKLGNIHAHAADLAFFFEDKDSTFCLDDSAGSALFFTIVEDFPYLQNRVTLKPGTQGEVHWKYHYPAELLQRGEMLLHAFCQAVPQWEVIIKQPSGSLNGSHACGTCRFGDDPRTSVLNRENRLHDLDNAYVLDASFLPSSGGIQPSLTIVANSLRASALIASR